MAVSMFSVAALTSAWDVCGHPVDGFWAEQSCSAQPGDQQTHRADLWATYPEDVGTEESQACAGCHYLARLGQQRTSQSVLQPL